MENNGGWMRPAHVEIQVLPAIETAGLAKEEMKELPARTRALIAEKLQKTEK